MFLKHSLFDAERIAALDTANLRISALPQINALCLPLLMEEC